MPFVCAMFLKVLDGQSLVLDFIRPMMMYFGSYSNGSMCLFSCVIFYLYFFSQLAATILIVVYSR